MGLGTFARYPQHQTKWQRLTAGQAVFTPNSSSWTMDIGVPIVISNGAGMKVCWVNVAQGPCNSIFVHNYHSRWDGTVSQKPRHAVYLVPRFVYCYPPVTLTRLSSCPVPDPIRSFLNSTPETSLLVGSKCGDILANMRHDNKKPPGCRRAFRLL